MAKREIFNGANPATAIEWYPDNARERFLTVEEMTRLGQALKVAETLGLPPAPQHTKEAQRNKKAPTPRDSTTSASRRTKNATSFTSEVKPASPVTVAALRFLMFTGWREQEALTLRRDAVDLERSTVTLTDTKSGKSVRIIPAPAVEILAAQARIVGSAYVFPGCNPMHPLREIQRVWYAARRHAKLDGVRLHDLRHSVASFAGGRGYSLFLIGKLLGHKDQRSTALYAHLADDIRKTMADDVGDVIRAAMESEGTATVVTPLHKAR